MRGTFANIRLKNLLPRRARRAADTLHLPDGDAACPSTTPP